MKESGYYPSGAEFDSNAPYNQPEIEYVICNDCDGTGYDEDGFEKCLICNGSGKLIRTFEDDLADDETAAEEKGDRIRNESHF